MIKKILIWSGGTIMTLAAIMFYFNYRNLTLSPPGTAEFTANELSSKITYSRPSVRERLIFGTEDQNAVQPYGKYWRMGANASTEVNFDRNVRINGQNLKAGTYKLYAFPGPYEFEVCVSTELGTWGHAEPDYSKEVMRLSIPVEELNPPVEQMTFRYDKMHKGMQLIMEFEKVRLIIPIEVAGPKF